MKQTSTCRSKQISTVITQPIRMQQVFKLSNQRTAPAAHHSHPPEDRQVCRQWGVCLLTDLSWMFLVEFDYFWQIWDQLCFCSVVIHNWNTSVCTERTSLICRVAVPTKEKVQPVQIYEHSNSQRLHQRAPWHHTSSSHQLSSVWTRSSMLRPDG